MILVKKIVDGKEIYQTVSIDEARKLKEEGVELWYTDEHEKNKVETGSYGYFDEEKKKLKEFGEKLEKTINDSVVTPINNMFNGQKKKNDKNNKLIKILPFMDEDDIHEIIERMLNSDESLKDLDIVSMLPFLSDEDCDKLFIKSLNDGNFNYEPSSIAPFVSEQALSLVVDAYIKGEFKNCKIESLYPFLSSKDVKRLFIHIMDNE